MRIEIHVRPGASRTQVGGSHDGVLAVRVVEPADAGKATAGAIRAVADALEVPRRCVTLVRGATSRRKMLEVSGTGVDDAALSERVRRLRDRPPQAPAGPGTTGEVPPPGA